MDAQALVSARRSPRIVRFSLSLLRAFARPSFASPEGGGAPERRWVTTGTFGGAARRVTGARASRRSTAAIFHAITVLLRSDRRASPLRSRQHLRCPSSDRVQPPKAGPSSGPDGDRASWDEGANLACRRRHPGSATERLRKAPSVNRDGVHHM